MTAADPGASPDETDLQAAIDARLASLDSGNYRANNRVVLDTFAEYLADHRGITDLEDLAVIDCRRYAQHLRERVNDEDDALSAASAHANGPYFTIVRAFLGWCVDDERIDANPARPNRVKGRNTTAITTGSSGRPKREKRCWSSPTSGCTRRWMNQPTTASGRSGTGPS